MTSPYFNPSLHSSGKSLFERRPEWRPRRDESPLAALAAGKERG